MATKRAFLTDRELTHVGIHQSPQLTHFLHAGQVWVATKPTEIAFILGSCVGVCLWDPISGVGGATHFLLPAWDGRGASSPLYGNVAIPVLLHHLVEVGARVERMRAKVFGGACLLNHLPKAGQNADQLGTRNTELATELLRERNIPIDLVEVGGNRGKRIAFRTNTGQTSVTSL